MLKRENIKFDGPGESGKTVRNYCLNCDGYHGHNSCGAILICGPNREMAIAEASRYGWLVLPGKRGTYTFCPEHKLEKR